MSVSLRRQSNSARSRKNRRRNCEQLAIWIFLDWLESRKWRERRKRRKADSSLTEKSLFRNLLTNYKKKEEHFWGLLSFFNDAEDSVTGRRYSLCDWIRSWKLSANVQRKIVQEISGIIQAHRDWRRKRIYQKGKFQFSASIRNSRILDIIRSKSRESSELG